MRMHLPEWLRAVAPAMGVSTGGVVSPSVPAVVSGVSRRLGAPLAALGVSLYVASCAEPNLDGLPEDPGDNLPIPTIGPPNQSEIASDAGMVPSDETNDDSDTTDSETGDDSDRSDDAEQDAGFIDPGNADASIVDPTGSPTTDTTGNTDPIGSTSTATSAGGSGSNATSTSATSAASSGGTDTTQAPTSSDATETTDTDDTTAVEADAGGWWYPDAGIADAGDTDTSDTQSSDTDTSDTQTSIELDAGDGGVDAGVEP